MPALSIGKVRPVMSEANSQMEHGCFTFTLENPPFEYYLNSGAYISLTDNDNFFREIDLRKARFFWLVVKAYQLLKLHAQVIYI